MHHYGSYFVARRTESPNDVTTSYATASRCVTTEVLHLFRCSTHTHTRCDTMSYVCHWSVYDSPFVLRLRFRRRANEPEAPGMQITSNHWGWRKSTRPNWTADVLVDFMCFSTLNPALCILQPFNEWLQVCDHLRRWSHTLVATSSETSRPF